MNNNTITARYSNGWQKMSSGLILQYGYFSGNSTTTVTGNFPIPFPSQVLVSFSTMGDIVQSSVLTVNFEHSSLSSWKASINTSSASYIFRYLAIGF